MFHIEDAVLHHLIKNPNGITKWDLFIKLKADFKESFEKSLKDLIDSKEVHKKNGKLYLQSEAPGSKCELLFDYIETQQPVCPSTVIKYGETKGISESTTMSIINSLRQQNRVHYCDDLLLMLTFKKIQNNCTDEEFTCLRCNYHCNDQVKFQTESLSNEKSITNPVEYEWMPEMTSVESQTETKTSETTVNIAVRTEPTEISESTFDIAMGSECAVDKGVETEPNNIENLLIHFEDNKISVDIPTYGCMSRAEFWKLSPTSSSIGTLTERNNLDKCTNTHAEKIDVAVETEKKENKGGLLDCLTSCFP